MKIGFLANVYSLHKPRCWMTSKHPGMCNNNYCTKMNVNLLSALCSSECSSSVIPQSSISSTNLPSVRVYDLYYLNLPLYTWPFCTDMFSNLTVSTSNVHVTWIISRLLNTFASQKSVFRDFHDTAWEWSLLTTLITNFQLKATFTPHLDT